MNYFVSDNMYIKSGIMWLASPPLALIEYLSIWFVQSSLSMEVSSTKLSHVLLASVEKKSTISVFEIVMRFTFINIPVRICDFGLVN